MSATSDRPQRPYGGSRFLGWLLALMVVVCILWPAAGIGWSIVRGAAKGLAPAAVVEEARPNGPALEMLPPLSLAPSVPLLVQTLAWALGVAVLATALAWPVAWVIRRRGWGVIGLVCVPLMLPSYLAYAAYNILRSPGWFLGNWLQKLAERGFSDAPMLAGRIMAAMGLALWAWPIAALVLGASVKRLDQSMLDALRLEAGVLRRGGIVLRLCGPGLVASVAAVTLVMLGSAVPFQLSMVSTYAIKVWLDLTLAPGSWRVWAAAWPLVVISMLAGWIVSTRILRAARTPDDAEAAPAAGVGRTRMNTAASVFTGIVWLASVVIPLVLFGVSLSVVNTDHGMALDMEQWGTVPRFFKLAGDSIVGSLWVACVVGAIAVVIAVAAWQRVSSMGAWDVMMRRAGSADGSRGTRIRHSPHSSPRLVLFVTRAFVITGIMPGVLVGAAVAAAANQTSLTRDLAETPWILVIGHIARFGFVPALVGIWLAAIEPRQERELRALDGGLNFSGWLGACLPVQAGALIAAALATGALSLHEIEAAVVIQPPGTPSLAQVMLAYLHQLRMTDLSAAGVVLVGGGLVVAVVAAMGVRWTARAMLDVGG